MKAVCIADLQGQAQAIDPKLIPDGDILLVAGDLGGWGDVEELTEFDNWIKKLHHKHKIVVAGNHDRVLMRVDGHNVFKNCTYLQDELIEIDGRRIYGTPASDMNNLYHRTSFNAFAAPEYLERVARAIPDDLDVLLAHGPCYGILDMTKYGEAVGSKFMRQAVVEKKPKYFVCGHIHESHGTLDVFGTTHINAALCSERNQMFIEKNLYFQPIVIDL